MRNLRHVVNVMRPGKSQDDRGQHVGQAEVVLKDVPCSIETLSGRELEQARGVWAEANYRVEMYGDPGIRINTTHWLEMNGRRLDIGDVQDPDLNGVKLVLLCGELKNLKV